MSPVSAAPVPLRLAYVVSEYPAVSHAFIQREVLALRALGVSVDTFTVYPAGDKSLLSETDRAEARSTHSVLPLRPLRIAAALTRAIGERRRVVSTLRLALSLRPGGPRGVARQLFYFAAALDVWSRCRARGIRHVHAHLATAGTDIALLIAELGGPAGTRRPAWTWSTTMHGTPKAHDQAVTLPLKLRRAPLVICASEAVRAHLMVTLEESVWPRLKVVHVGVDTAAFRPPASRPPRAEAHLLTVARLVPLKAQRLLLEALAELVHDHSVPARLTVVGDGPLRDSLERTAAQLGVRDRVTFAGAVGQDRIQSYYSAADIFCLPSLLEGLPAVLMEAMATELPVVATRIMGVPELVDHGVSGLLVTPGRSSELARALLELISSPERRDRLGRAGRVRVQSEFELDDCARELAQHFAGLRDGAPVQRVASPDRPGSEAAIGGPAGGSGR